MQKKIIGENTGIIYRLIDKKRKLTLKKLSVIFLVPIIIYSCGDFIEYSPYDTNVSSENININNAESISNIIELVDTLKFALFTDSHTNYDDLEDAILNINNMEDLQFVVCCGDVTDKGLNQEFIWYYEIIENSRYPVITVIGNHDYRSNGLKIYEQMFGASNMSFTSMGYNFIVFDDIVWENNNKSPKFDWLQTELAKNNLPSILLAHIPPWSDQLEGTYRLVLKEIISESNLILCLFGHSHSFTHQPFAGIPAIVSNNIKDREYCVIQLFGNQYKVERVKF